MNLRLPFHWLDDGLGRVGRVGRVAVATLAFSSSLFLFSIFTSSHLRAAGVRFEVPYLYYP